MRHNASNMPQQAPPFDELQRVLTYPEFALAPAARDALYMEYERLAHRVESGVAQPLPRCRDTDDQKFLELAARSGAELLVSKDKALLRLRGRTRLPFAIVAPLAVLAVHAQGARRGNHGYRRCVPAVRIAAA